MVHIIINSKVPNKKSAVQIKRKTSPKNCPKIKKNIRNYKYIINIYICLFLKENVSTSKIISRVTTNQFFSQDRSLIQVSDCCLMPIQQLFSYIMERTS